MCEFYKVPIYFYGDKDTLGHAMGKEFRASLAILDEGFAKGIQKQFETVRRDNCIKEVVYNMTKMRVHELAKELGMDNKELIGYSCKEKSGSEKPYEYSGRAVLTRIQSKKRVCRVRRN